MKVILDTTVLTEDPNFKKTEMIVLRRLCNEEKIKLMITETVYREFCTQRQEKVKNTGNNCLSELKKFDNTVYGIYKREIENVIKIIENGIYNSDKIIKEKIDYYIKQTKATILKPTIDDYNEVFERYFKGDKPFKKIKSRDDILDAIIFVQTKRMKEKRLVFISHDNK
ncbi:MAG: PIN domain-containing protein, partial [Treponema sp.]|nr:PIN domain-containing protein [Treponema sp.]